MASTAASAVKYDLAQRRLAAVMAKLSESFSVPVPPPVGRMDDPLQRHAAESERMAGFLEAIDAKQLQPETNP
jgi:hypothetical protein